MQETCQVLPWEALAWPAAYLPHDLSATKGVDWLQTHISHVYRTEERVYKFRKPVTFGFVRFGTREKRNADCLREMELNRRLAPDVYLGVAPLLGSPEQPRIGPLSEKLATGLDGLPTEHCVVMRRLPEGRDALSLLRAGALREAQLEQLASRIAAFHAEQGLGAPAPFSAEAWLECCTGPTRENFRVLAECGDGIVDPDLLRVARTRAEHVAASRRDCFEDRRRAGRAVDGHGDLHLEHVWFESAWARPLMIDCLEFDPRLRRIDAAAEVAFLAMDLRYRGHARLAEHFLRCYARESDDFDLYSVVDYFVAYRAGVRAKVAALATRDEGLPLVQREAAAGSAHRHLDLARNVLATRSAAPLVLVSGIVGSGKSTLAAELESRVGGVVISSDRVRKSLLGVAAHGRAGPGAYTARVTELTYAALLQRARAVAGSGRVAILDATFSRRAERRHAAELARALGVEVYAVEAHCEADEARRRLAERERQGTDASDAGPGIYEWSARRFEPLDEWPTATRLRVHTDHPGWASSLEPLVAMLRRG